jgi:hypothetical protein
MLRPRERASCILLSLALWASGCNDATHSCQVENERLLLRATVSELDAVPGEPRVRVEVELEAVSDGPGSGTTLALCPEGDRLEVNGVEAEELDTLGHLYYIAEFQDRAPSFEIALTRPSHEDVTLTIELPPSFEISQPMAGAELPRDAALDIAWSPAWTDHQLALQVADEIGSACIDGLGIDLDVDDSGTYSVPAGMLVGTGSCQVTISLTRLAEGEYPSSLAPGGNATAIVKRRLVVTSI